MPRGVRVALLAFCLGAALPATAGDVVGRVDWGIDGVPFGDLGPFVAFLDPIGAEAGAWPGRPQVTVRQIDAQFDPEFLIVSTGQEIEMPNRDGIYHNVFSFSKPNDFDLGLYPEGESRTVSFAHAGVVRIYCSIHESMSGLILVVPSPWFSRLDGSGRFEIGDVPAGDYELVLWNEKLPEDRRTISVPASGSVRAELRIGVQDP